MAASVHDMVLFVNSVVVEGFELHVGSFAQSRGDQFNFRSRAWGEVGT